MSLWLCLHLHCCPLFGQIVLMAPEESVLLMPILQRKEKKKKLPMRDLSEIFGQAYTALFSSRIFYFFLSHCKSVKVKHKGLTLRCLHTSSTHWAHPCYHDGQQVSGLGSCKSKWQLGSLATCVRGRLRWIKLLKQSHPSQWRDSNLPLWSAQLFPLSQH